jgi:GAF domain-containing protein
VIGLGRTIGGDFLSSEDVELLESLASYIGIALQNASLYARLEAKIGEFERLKEFNENIVESINVGILASISTTASKAGTRRWRPCTPSAAPKPSARSFVPSSL